MFVTGVFLVFFRQQPETTFEQCSFDFRIPRRYDVDGNFLLRSLHVLTLHSPYDVRDGRPFSIMLVKLAFNAIRNSCIKPKKC